MTDEEKIDNFVDLMFSFDMKELENETKFLENYKKLQQENKLLKEVYEELNKFVEENRTRYIYQDGLGEDWRFEDLDVYNELSEILDKVKIEGE